MCVIGLMLSSTKEPGIPLGVLLAKKWWPVFTPTHRFSISNHSSTYLELRSIFFYPKNSACHGLQFAMFKVVKKV